jgi:ParB-like chromosome segregation protein Spo0J
MIQSINDGDKLPPIRVIQHPYDESKYIVVDGNHRRYAFLKSDVDEVDAIIIPHDDVVLMKSKWGENNDELGKLSELKDNKKIIDKYFVKPDGTNNFKQPK